MLSFQKKRKPVTAGGPLQSWWVPAGVIIVAGVAIVGLHAGVVSFSSRPAWAFVVLLAVMEVLVAIWILAFSPLASHWRVIALTSFVAAQAGSFQLVRLDGFLGDGRPIWVWRWQATAGSAFDWNDGRRLSVATTTPAIDLTLVSPRDYPEFRGHDRTGRASGAPLSTDWIATPPRLFWRQPVGSGWSSFAIVGDYCVTQEQRGEREATVCYELRTGRQCWVHEEHVRFYEATSGDGPRATPTIHQGRVYSLGATGILNCLEGATGRPVWTVSILDDNAASNRLFGVTGSPLVAGRLVIVNAGGPDSSLAAYDRATGERVWRAGTSGASYSSPQWAILNGIEQVLDFNADGLSAHELISGKLLWSVPWISNPAERNNVCQPVIVSANRAGVADSVFIASGYGQGCALFAVKPADAGFIPVERWHNRNLKAKFSSVVVHEGYAFGFDDAILTCVDVSSGQRRWKGGRYGYGQLLLSGSILLVQLETGEVALVEASPDAFRELARFEALDSRTWNHPALSGRYLVVRNDREAACYELPLAESRSERER